MPTLQRFLLMTLSNCLHLSLWSFLPGKKNIAELFAAAQYCASLHRLAQYPKNLPFITLYF